MSAPTCANCAYFVVRSEAGSCHRYPPTVTEDVTCGTDRETGALDSVCSVTKSSWPEVDSTDLCGEHQPAPEGKL